jgi:protein-disulfide isomerase
MRFRSLLLVFSLLTTAAVAADTDLRLGPPFAKRDRPTLGSDEAPIVVIEFASYRCDHCLTFHQRALPAIRKQYIASGKVQWVMVPSSFDASHRFSRLFALGRCALQQGKFWDVLEYIMGNSQHSADLLEQRVGKHPAIDREALGSCVRDRHTQQVIDADFREHDALKIRQTPTFIIRRRHRDGTHTEARLEGLQELEYFQRVLEELLKKS